MRTKIPIMPLFCFLLAAASAPAQDILDAVKLNDLNRIKAIIQADPQAVHGKDNRDCTPLHWACDGGNPETVSLLIANGADLKARDTDGDTPLHWAAVKGNASIVEILIKKGADIESRNEEQQTPFMVVARNTGNVEIGKLLLHHGADIQPHDNAGYMPLNWSAVFGHRDFIDFLLDHGSGFDSRGGKDLEMLRLAARVGSVRLFKLVVEKSDHLFAAGSVDSETMRWAVAGGSVEIVEMLLAKNVPVKDEAYSDGWGPLHLAARNGHSAMVEFLAKKGFALDQRTPLGKSAYNIAADAGKKDVMQLLLKLGGSPAAQQFPELKGPYLGQTPPGNKAEVFGPDIISANHSSVTIAPDGKEIYWQSAAERVIWMIKMQNGRWTMPEAVPFSLAVKGKYIDDVPMITPDGKKMFFTSTRPVGPDLPRKENIWHANRTTDGWSEPRPLGAEVNGMSLHWQVSVANSGTLYFGGLGDGKHSGNWDIYCSKLVNGKYAQPFNMGPVINSSALEGMPFIAPDESYIIFGRQTVTAGTVYNGLYISFKGRNGQWLAPISLGPYTNQGACPSISPDGKYLFYLAGDGGAGIRWMAAGFIAELRPKEIN